MCAYVSYEQIGHHFLRFEREWSKNLCHTGALAYIRDNYHDKADPE
jgi:hypothetical protein